MAMGTMIGIILLMGLVTKNAILLVDRAIVRVREHGEPPLQAILEAGPERLRPILMTSAAMVLGMLPTALVQRRRQRVPRAHGDRGHRRRRSARRCCRSWSCPVFYLAIENAKATLARWFGSSSPDAPAPAPGAE